MKVFILAAGLGKRMLPLSLETPKPLLEVGGRPMVEHLVLRLKAQGFDDFVMNTSVHADQFERVIGDGDRLGVKVKLHHENEHPLGTADGIRAALHLLDDQTFLVVNADICCEVDFRTLELARDKLAEAVLVDNPEHNTRGDFAIVGLDTLVPIHPPEPYRGAQTRNHPSYTFGGVSLVDPDLLMQTYALEYSGMNDVLAVACLHHHLGHTYHQGFWLDVGSPRRLEEMSDWIRPANDEPSV